ncbi:hypothetical protein V865_006145 [Kwoniella europaea PYCC6329]|uniref:Uncharacterized protein n=1 Tax=Kwoniella europaea PYCC6329 TaxID=1423913 RepID=A0AAX4KR51_9TREE
MARYGARGTGRGTGSSPAARYVRSITRNFSQAGFDEFGSDTADPSDDTNVPSGISGASQSPQPKPPQRNDEEDKTMANNTTSGSERVRDVGEGTRSRTLSLERQVKSSEQDSASTTATIEASTPGRSMQPTVKDDLEDWEQV